MNEDKKYQANVRGVFTKRQQVVAKSFEEAEEMFKSNQGEDIEESLTGWVEVEDIETIE